MQICPSAAILSYWGGLNPLINVKSQSICWPQKLSGGFPSHIPFSHHLLSLPHPQIVSGTPSYCSAGVPGRSKRKAFFFFSLPHCASSLAFLFPLGRGCFLSWACSKKRCQVSPPCSVLPTVIVQRLLHKAGVVGRQSRSGLLIAESRSWFLAHCFWCEITKLRKGV